MIEKVLWVMIGCFTVSCLTLPFVGRIWVGEIPVLSLLQFPKITLAGWLRTHLVMPAITFLGFSRGSFSPDFILARPFALAIVYLIPLIILGFIGLRNFRFLDTRQRLVMALFLVVAIVDYVCTLVFADGRFLTIY